MSKARPKDKEDVEEVDKTKQQFGISESEMKSKLPQVVETWDLTSGGKKMTQQRVLRKTLIHFGKGNMSSNACLQRKQLGKLLDSIYGPEQKNRLFTNDPDTVDLPFKTEDDTTHLTPSQQVNDPLLSDAELNKLDSHGIVRISQVFSQQTVVALRLALTKMLKDYNNKPKGRKTLSDTQGNGRNGFYFYFDPDDLDCLNHLRENIIKQLYREHKEQAQETSFIALCYGEGGENYTHQDNTATKQDKTPAIRYQALVLLNTPGKDFNGGELYVQDGRVPMTTMTNDKHECVAPTKNQTSNFACGGQAGDVVVFKANGSGGGKNWFHGMTEVTKGTNDVCQRWGIGLFQPPNKQSKDRGKETGKRKGNHSVSSSSSSSLSSSSQSSSRRKTSDKSYNNTTEN